MNTEQPENIGGKYQRNGFCVIARETSTQRPWLWVFPTLAEAKLLAKTLCEELDQEVRICATVGIMKRQLAPTEFIESEPRQ